MGRPRSRSQIEGRDLTAPLLERKRGLCRILQTVETRLIHLDPRLDRTVAIKILLQSLASDPQLRERFYPEVRAI